MTKRVVGYLGRGLLITAGVVVLGYGIVSQSHQLLQEPTLYEGAIVESVRTYRHPNELTGSKSGFIVKIDGEEREIRFSNGVFRRWDPVEEGDIVDIETKTNLPPFDNELTGSSIEQSEG